MEGSRITGILDWATGGFYPAYFRMHTRSTFYDARVEAGTSTSLSGWASRKGDKCSLRTCACCREHSRVTDGTLSTELGFSSGACWIPAMTTQIFRCRAALLSLLLDALTHTHYLSDLSQCFPPDVILGSFNSLFNYLSTIYTQVGRSRHHMERCAAPRALWYGVIWRVFWRV